MMNGDAIQAREENRFIFYSSPGTLASLACSKVALVCWSFDICGLYPDEVSNLNQYITWFMERKLSCTDVYKTSLPSSIVEKIDIYIKIVGSNLNRLMRELHVIFNDDIHDVMSRCIDHIIIEADGSISPKKTARSLLDRDGLNCHEKYAIACEYCFESDIRRLWPSVANDPFRGTRKRIGGKPQKPEVEIGEYPTIYYWNCRMNDLASSLIPDTDLRVWPWTMIEHLWDELELESVLDNHNWRKSPSAIRYLLPKLNTEQLAIHLKENYFEILMHLTDNEENARYAVQIWDYLLANNEITEMVFAELMENFLFITEIDEFTDEIWHLNFPFVTIFLRHIWTNGKEDWKKNFINQRLFSHLASNFSECLYLLLKAQHKNKEFFLEFLTNMESQDRTKLWLEYWKKFIVLADASDLKVIVKLCVPEDDEQMCIKFRKRMVNYKQLKTEFDVFVVSGRCVELDNYLKLFSSSAAEEKRVRRQIADSNLNKIFQFDSEILKKFYSFFDGAFSSASLANQQKEEYFRENIDNMYALLDRGSLNNMKSNVHFLLSHNIEYLAEMKQIFLLRCRNTLISGSVENFNIRHWQEFIKWCSTTDEDFVKFKESLPLDDIFQTWLVKCCQGSYRCWCEIQARLTHLSYFVHWYLDKRNAVEKYLLKNIANFEQVCLKQEAKVTFGMLLWFFFNDREEIEKFCTRSRLQIENFSSHLEGCRRPRYRTFVDPMNQPAPQPELRRSTRNRRKPDWYRP